MHQLIRPRRNRKNEIVRSHIRETHLHPGQLIYPLFVQDGKDQKTPIPSLPDNYRLSTGLLINEIEKCLELGIKTFVLFPVVEKKFKDNTASFSYHPENFYLDAIRKIKNQLPEACIVTDVAMDPYSSDGHDGIVKNGEILNDETLEVLTKMSVAQAEAGADIIGPSDMMDGRIRHIRNGLDDKGFKTVSIMSYTAKYASAFYGPFRDALDSAPRAGDKKTYQMDPSNKREALTEAKLDLEEGADYLMVKPALLYLDVIHLLKQNFELPVAAYNVSGEYAMLKAAAQNGWLNYSEAMTEMLLSIKRAGANVILTYFAREFAEIYRNK